MITTREEGTKRAGPKEDRGKILTYIAEFNTVLQILNKRIEILEARLKHTETELEEYKKQVQKAVCKIKNVKKALKKRFRMAI